MIPSFEDPGCSAGLLAEDFELLYKLLVWTYYPSLQTGQRPSITIVVRVTS